ncbi:MAG: hypothetical protein HQK76_20720 [Desulfobacterales bacterium]|nr:hypothetical protein [Desulfobacterales bacterium]
MLFCSTSNSEEVKKDIKDIKEIKEESAKALSPKEYWIELKKAADRFYGGYWSSVEVNLSGGYERREFEAEAKTAPFGEFKVSIPLYSKEFIMKRENAKQEYLRSGADLVSQIEEKESLLVVYNEQIKAYKDLLKNSSNLDDDTSKSTQILDKYMDLNKQMITIKAQYNSAVNKLEAMLKCGN